MPSTPVSSNVVAGAKLPVFWGSASLQGLDVGIFIALALAVVFWLLINRTRLGYEARTVGFNPDAARYAGINVGRTWIRVMLICGAFAGVAAALDILGWKFNLFTNDIQTSQIGFYGIAVALLGRNTAGGTVAAAVLFGALLDRHLGSQHPPEHRPDPRPVPDVHDRGDHHPARLDRRDHAPAAEGRAAAPRGAQAKTGPLRRPAHGRTGRCVVSVGTVAVATAARISPKQIGIAGVVLAAVAWVITIPPIEVARHGAVDRARRRSPSRAGAWSIAGGERKLGSEAIVVAAVRGRRRRRIGRTRRSRRSSPCSRGRRWWRRRSVMRRRSCSRRSVA